MTEQVVAAATRQRKKRKWDQPAEDVLSAAVVAAAAAAAVPSLLPFTAAGALAGLGALRGVFPSYVNCFPAFSAGKVQSVAGQVAPTNARQNAAALVQRFNQDLASKGLLLPAKIQDEIIAREITINDADPGVRYRLTKRQTQEEIQAKTGAVVITRGRYQPPTGAVDLEKPLYLHISGGTNLKDTAERIKAVDQAAAIVEEMLKQGQLSQVPLRSSVPGAVTNGSGCAPLAVKIFLGFEADPSFNLVGRICGPNGQYINHIMNETGATVVLRGRDSGNNEGPPGDELSQPLHLLISSDNGKSVEDAKVLAENLLETIRADSFPFRLPAYQVLPSAILPPLTSYPPTRITPYQVSQYPVASSTQGSYGACYPSASIGYPLPQAMSQHPSPSFPTTMIAASSDQQAVSNISSMNPYTNMLPPSKVYDAVPPPAELSGDQLTEKSCEANEDPAQKKPYVRIREKFSQSSPIESIVPIPASMALPMPNFTTSNHSISNTDRTPASKSYATSHFQPHHLNGAAHMSVSTSWLSQASLPGTPGQSAYPHGQIPVTPSYTGYGGVYPDASSLGRGAQALQRSPPRGSLKPLQNSTFLATLTKAQSSSFQEKHSDKQPAQRRKFQEFPIGGKDSSGDDQKGWRGLISSGLDASTPSEEPDPSSSRSMHPPPPKSMPVPQPSMPPPKFLPSTSPPRTTSLSSFPPNASGSPSVTTVFKQQDEDAAPPGTGLKLVEYGEEDDEAYTGPEAASESNPYVSGKPFWAA